MSVFGGMVKRMPAGYYGGSPQGGATGLYGQPYNSGQTPTNSAATPYALHNTAVEQQAGDYGNIMQGYKDLMGNLKADAGANRGTYAPQYASAQTANYQPATYQQSGDRTASIKNAAELARTGGYSEQGIADLRARGISPIRSIYSSANRDVDRQRGLQGGYSPNHGALKAKMAREMSEQIAGQISNVNAGIAQNVASNRISASPTYASAAASENDAVNAFNMQNAQAVNQMNQFNAGAGNQVGLFNAGASNDANRFNAGVGTNRDAQMLQALGGMNSLYGTTPALSQLFGQQALQGSQLQNQITQDNRQNENQLTQQFVNGLNQGKRNG